MNDSLRELNSADSPHQGRLMRLRILLPTRVLTDQATARIVADAENGSFCLLPRHIDMVASLAPGILAWRDPQHQKRYAGVADGVLVKNGFDVRVSVQFGVIGDDLMALQQAVLDHRSALDECERQALSAAAHLESDFVRRYLELEGRLHV